MLVLGIETSCDETAASVVKDGKEVLSSVIASSAEMHVKTGGIIPERAARQQIKSILPVIGEAFKKADKKQKEIDAIAVTVGPGLIGSLLVGIETAKTLSSLWKKPIIPVNHLVAHLYANWLGGALPVFPLIGLVVSGGHTDLVYMKGHGQLELIGTTRDDAAGECFDKCARILGLPYPGGPSIAKEADDYLRGHKNPILNIFPRPMIGEKNFDFSFSGLKTAVLREKDRVKKLKEKVPEFSANVQEAVVDVLVDKTVKAFKKYHSESLLLGGGVSANARLTEKLKIILRKNGLSPKLFVPEPKLCTDNAAVIASCAFYNNRPIPWQKVFPNPELMIVS
ncbi:tRNA (adenosine(37)-N6)-threonylcarbamoyltransferase complex transferase subunit TsaD [Candidatus Woesebacteria bacterium]|nr:tRNA (adenosine(37)-N6)-threonylcarbamoyltransferase complex transferase subunit TsaD [Candidatus Woesebacteria bacterium]